MIVDRLVNPATTLVWSMEKFGTASEFEGTANENLNRMLSGVTLTPEVETRAAVSRLTLLEPMTGFTIFEAVPAKETVVKLLKVTGTSLATLN